METRDLRRWFEEEELRPCPRCRRQTALDTPRGAFVLCFDCGLVGAQGDDEQSDAA